MSYKYVLSIGFLLAGNHPAAARDIPRATVGQCADAGPGSPVCEDADGVPKPAPTAITVTATGVAQPLDATGQAVTVIGAQEIASIQGPDLTRVFQRVPGLSLTRNGGLGGFTGVRLRGADSEQTLVLIDGVPVADVSSPGGGFDFGTLQTAGVQSVEVLRGSNSLVWGSDAIGGVIAVTTRQIQGVEGSLEYGANGTYAGAASGGFASGGLRVTLDGGYTRSDGISQLAGDPERDGLDQWQAGARLSYDLGSGLSLFADGRHARSEVGLDYSFADDYVQTTRQTSGRAGLRYHSEVLDLAGYFAVAGTRRAYDSPTWGGYDYEGLDRRLDLTGRWRLLPGLSAIFGADHRWSHYSGTYDQRQSDWQTSAHALLELSHRGLRLSGGARIDDHSRFGQVWTVGGNGSLALGSGWRLRASYGEGFKAPTLYQLYSSSGNADLRPERSRSLDAGIERGDRSGALHLAATVFRRDSRDLIDYDYTANGGWGGYVNLGRARATGLELEADVRPVPALQVHAAYTFVKSIRRDTGQDLQRRPRHVVSLAADWITPLAGLALGGDLTMVGDSRDVDALSNPVTLDGYAIATLRASLPLSDRLEVFGRIENLTDARYQSVYGYNTPGRSAYAGVRVSL